MINKIEKLNMKMRRAIPSTREDEHDDAPSLQ